MRLSAAPAVFRGCWRPDPPSAPADPAALRTAEQGGCGALACHRFDPAVLSPELRARREALLLRQHARHRLRERAIVEVAGRLNRAGVRWLLFKGWAAARCYGRPELRSVGDLDLVVEPADRSRAIEALVGWSEVLPLDLHTAFRPLYERSFAAIRESAETVDLGGEPVPIPAPEEHLRLTCLHFWHHSGRRPIWLCDIAAALEARPSALDWDRCLHGSARAARWVEAGCRLAVDLLDARPEALPFEVRPLPEWLVGAVLEHWRRPAASWSAPRLAASLRHPERWELLRRYARLRCPDPIRAALRAGSPFQPFAPAAQQAFLTAVDLARSGLRSMPG